ncbi:protein tas-like isoform X3 [Vitis riparia]|uniref:protein tas-like isoform X3 n=1 Tax=Vitis riparia TaxID=96939 RepID=UPI00155B2B2F|nr:protein tas-like isoform X3 [Vitis riparia]
MGVPVFNLAPDLTVSRLCLGTMTFGEQNSLSQSFGLLSQAFHSGTSFFDSAEMYPVPQRAETQGKSEEHSGRWIRETKIPVIALSWRQSLKRLRTNYIDLYQIHWPDRYVPMFGETEYDPTRQFSSVFIEEQLDALGRAVDAGKVHWTQ